MTVTAPLRKTNSLVYIRVHDGNDIDFKVSTGIYIDPDLLALIATAGLLSPCH